ncbi:hypothetical protein Nmel_017645 [Mimus melanotis]
MKQHLQAWGWIWAELISLLFLEAQLVLHPPGHVGSCEDRAGDSEEEQGREVVSQVPLEGGVDLPPGLIVQHHSLDLRQRAEHQEHVEDLVALPKEVTLPREPLLGVGVGEEEGTDEEEEHLALVVEQGGVGLCRGADAMDHGADVQQIGQARRQLLAQAAGQRAAGVEVELGIAGASTGQPGQGCSQGQEEALDVPVPAWLDGVVEMAQGAAILVHSHPHIVHEEEAVVPELRLGLQQVGEAAEGQVGEGGGQDDEQGPGMLVLPEVHALPELLEAQQQHQGGPQV